MNQTTPRTQLIALTTLLASTAACTKHVPINPDVAIAEKKLDGLVLAVVVVAGTVGFVLFSVFGLLFTHGRVIVAERAEVSGPDVVVRVAKEEGRLHTLEPRLVIHRAEIESIPRPKGPDSNTFLNVVAVTIFVAVIGLIYTADKW